MTRVADLAHRRSGMGSAGKGNRKGQRRRMLCQHIVGKARVLFRICVYMAGWGVVVGCHKSKGQEGKKKGDG
jgi:hypothetical protein